MADSIGKNPAQGGTGVGLRGCEPQMVSNFCFGVTTINNNSTMLDGDRDPNLPPEGVLRVHYLCTGVGFSSRVESEGTHQICPLALQ